MQVTIPFINQTANQNADTVWDNAYSFECDTPGGVYPLGDNGLWHTAIHVQNKETGDKKSLFFKSLLNGTVVSSNMFEATEYKEIDCPIPDTLAFFSNIWDRLAQMKANHNDLYKRVADGQDWPSDAVCYKINHGQAFSEDALKVFKSYFFTYSTCYMLVKHTLKRQGKDIAFYILYSNLATIGDIAKKEQCRCFFRKWTVDRNEMEKNTNNTCSLYSERTGSQKILKDDFDLDAVGATLEILDTEKQQGHMYFVKIVVSSNTYFGYVKLKNSNNIKVANKTPLEGAAATGYLGMQRSGGEDAAVHIELFMPVPVELWEEPKCIADMDDRKYDIDAVQRGIDPQKVPYTSAFGKNVDLVKIKKTEKLHMALANLVIMCPTMWDDQVEDIAKVYGYSKFQPEIRDPYVKCVKSQFWMTQDVKKKAFGPEGGNRKIFYYMHPFTFLKHITGNTQNFDFSFNPYAGTHTTTDGISFICNSNNGNPGFVPRYTTGNDEYTFNNLHFAVVTGKFNQEYAHLPQYEKNWLSYHHEGVDFRGTIGTDVIALVEAVVLGFGWMGTYGKTLILANNKTKGVYLLGHLHSFMPGLKVGSTIYPLDVVAKSGQSSSDRLVNTGMSQHLHVSYFDYQYTGTPIIVNSAGTLSWVSGTLNPYTDVKDPFNHSMPKSEDMRKPKATERVT